VPERELKIIGPVGPSAITRISGGILGEPLVFDPPLEIPFTGSLPAGVFEIPAEVVIANFSIKGAGRDETILQIVYHPETVDGSEAATKGNPDSAKP
jgi:hypothetical protein